MTYIVSACVLLPFVLILYMLFKAHHDTIEYRTITASNLLSEINMFFISDIHRRNISTNTLRSIQKEVNLVVIGGDLTEKGVSIDRTRENIRKLKRWDAPVYFVWGNNDYEAFPNEIYHLLKSEGVTILTNSNHDILVDTQTISLIGLDCCKYSEARIDLAIQNTNGIFNILLTHDPSAFYEMDESFQNKIDMVLAGHTHGGQIRVFGFGYFEKGGLTKLRNTKILISEGYGYTRLPFRLGTRSECHVLTFKQ